jgi:DNA primase
VPGLISSQILDQIRHNNDVVEVIGSYFPLKRAGANFRALCPFHKEKTPSFNVNPQKQIWHCFGCGAGGDVFSFVMKYESLEFVAAVRRLAERAGIRVEFDEGADRSSRDQKELLFRLHEEVAGFFHDVLLKDKSAEPARQYIEKRKISAETVRNWRLGYSPHSWDALIQWARTKKYTAELLEAGGLALPGSPRSERGQRRHYDRFRGRLMFPICDEQGRVVAFSGRILTEAKDQPKYVNSPETPIFQKGKILFALDRAKKSILEEKLALVCEGQLDAISCHEAGLTNVVAPQGTALTEQHARILKRYTDEIVLMFDADAAGQNAVVRSAEPLLAADLVTRVAILPQPYDPDSFVKNSGAEALKEVVTKSPSFFVYLLERLSQQHDAASDRGKLLIAQQMVEYVAKIPNAVLRATYVRETAGLLDIPESAVMLELNKFKARGRGAGDTTAAPLTTAPRSSSPASEEVLLQLMLADERIIEFVDERLDRTWLSQSVAANLIRRVLQLASANRWTGPTTLLNELHDEESQRLASALMLRPATPGRMELAAADCLARLERRGVERQMREAAKRLEQPGLSVTETMRLNKQILDLTNKLAHISAPSMPKAKARPD